MALTGCPLSYVSAIGLYCSPTFCLCCLLSFVSDVVYCLWCCLLCLFGNLSPVHIKTPSTDALDKCPPIVTEQQQNNKRRKICWKIKICIFTETNICSMIGNNLQLSSRLGSFSPAPVLPWPSRGCGVFVGHSGWEIEQHHRDILHHRGQQTQWTIDSIGHNRQHWRQ